MTRKTYHSDHPVTRKPTENQVWPGPIESASLVKEILDDLGLVQEDHDSAPGYDRVYRSVLVCPFFELRVGAGPRDLGEITDNGPCGWSRGVSFRSATQLSDFENEEQDECPSDQGDR